MSIRLLDTNIVSYRVRQHPVARKYRKHLAGYALAISFQTQGELNEWSVGLGPANLAALAVFFLPVLVLHSDEAICRRWAKVRITRRSRPIAVDDAWIAATALAHGFELVTHNPADFAGVPGLTVITEAP